MKNKEITIRRPKPHHSQKEVIAQKKRFNVLANGRRWGKSKLAVKLAIDTVLEGGPVGYFVPTYEFSDEFWEEIKERLEPITVFRNETRRYLKTITGGSVKCWSLEKKRAGRGRKYKRAIIDEAAFVKDLKESWEKVIRATLVDLKGDAWFLSTPYGNKNYFKFLFDQEKTKDNWKSFQMPTSTNPYISKEELEEIKSQFDDITWQQEFLAIFVDYTGRPFAYSFDKTKHVRDFKLPVQKYPLYLSFDFNIDPITCLVCQHNETKIRIHDEFRLQNSDIYKLCDAIKQKYPGFYYLVTGDASGKNSSAMVRDKINYYVIIKEELGLAHNQLRVPKANPKISNSRVLTNSILAKHPDMAIHPRCIFLGEDLQFVEVGDNGEIDKTKDKHLSHLLDCFVGETPIITSDGLKNIESINIGDFVLTRDGFKQIIDKWDSISDVYEFNFSDGRKIRCTKDHRFFTKSFGWLPILSIFEKNIKLWRSDIMEEDIQMIMEQNILQPHSVKNINTEDYINRNGSIISEKFQKAMTFIISMKIYLTMKLKILNVLKRKSIVQNTCEKELMKTWKSSENKWIMRENLQTNGMDPKRVSNGIKNMLKISDLGIKIMANQNVNFVKNSISKNHFIQNSAQIIASLHGEEKRTQIRKSQNALNVEMNLKRENIIPKNIAQKNVGPHQIHSEIKVISVKYIGKQKVYDITVKDSHEFFANGFLVHNCLRYYFNAFHYNFIKYGKKK